MPDDRSTPPPYPLVSNLAALLHAVVVLLHVSERDVIAPIEADVAAATKLLQRCVIRVGRRTDGRAALEDRGVRRHKLSPRERMIVDALVQNRSYKDVAHDLDMSLSSVQARVKSIYAKLGVHSKAELKSVVESRPSSEEPPASPGTASLP